MDNISINKKIDLKRNIDNSTNIFNKRIGGDFTEVAYFYIKVNKLQDAIKTLEDHITHHVDSVLEMVSKKKKTDDKNIISIVNDVSLKYPVIYLFTVQNIICVIIINNEKIYSLLLKNGYEEIISQKNSFYKKINALKGNKKISNENAGMKRLTELLGTYVMSPILETLSLPEEILIIPIGVLRDLPLHASWVSINGRYLYVLEKITIRYAPSINYINPMISNMENPKLLAISEPQQQYSNTISSIPSSNIEVNIIGQLFSQIKILRGAQATLDNINSALTKDYETYHILHFACHARSNKLNPLQAGLLMADEKIFSIEDFVKKELNIRLVTLSACETQAIDKDGIVNLPIGLLYSGVGGVIASLWVVEDISSMILMIKFYELLQNFFDNPAKALHQAQLWMITSSLDEKIKFLKDYIPDTQVKKLRRRIFITDYSKPYFWAAFTYIGV